MDATTAQIIKRLPGSWRLPNRDDNSVTITFYPDGNFGWTVSAYSVVQKTTQIFTGPFWRGNWQVRPQKSAVGYSDYFTTLNWGVQETLAECLSLFSLPAERRPPPRFPVAIPGPFLVLNFTDLSQSILNLSILGVRLDVANWMNNIAEVFRDGNQRIVEISDESLRIEGSRNSVETWFRV